MKTPVKDCGMGSFGGSLRAEPWWESWLTAAALLAVVLWDSWMEAPSAIRIRHLRTCRLAAVAKAGVQMCQQAPSRDFLVTWEQAAGKQQEWCPPAYLVFEKVVPDLLECVLMYVFSHVSCVGVSQLYSGSFLETIAPCQLYIWNIHGNGES